MTDFERIKLDLLDRFHVNRYDKRQVLEKLLRTTEVGKLESAAPHAASVD